MVKNRWISFEQIDWGNINQAQQYDLEHYSKTDDIDFWVGVAKKARGDILEIGCGTGRVTLPILKKGFKVYGIDKSSVMIGELMRNTKRAGMKIMPRMYVDDMKTFDLKRRFYLIICPFNTFLTLLSDDEREAFLVNIYSHLEKGGKFIFDVITPDTGYLVHTKKWSLEKTNKLPNGFVSKRYFLNKGRDVNRKIVNIKFKTELYDNKGRLVNKWFFDYFTAFFTSQEIKNMVERYGFMIETVYGNYRKTKIERIKKPRNQIFVVKKD